MPAPRCSWVLPNDSQTTRSNTPISRRSVLESLRKKSRKSGASSALKGVLDVSGESPGLPSLAGFLGFGMEVFGGAAPFFRREAVFVFHVVCRGDVDRAQCDDSAIVHNADL